MYTGIKKAVASWSDFYRACLDAHKMQQEKQYQLKIAESTFSESNKEILFTIQIVKTGFYPTYSARELAKYPDVLSLFAQEDRERIVSAAEGKQTADSAKRISLEITESFRNRSENRTYFKISSQVDGNTQSQYVSAESLSVSQLLSKLSPSDAYRAGYAAGQDEIQHEIESIQALKVST